MYGYRVTSEALPVLPKDPRPGASIASAVCKDDTYRPVSVSLPMYLEGAVRPKPDGSHAESIAYGFLKRVVNPVTEEFDPAVIEEFAVFVLKWLKDNLCPLDPLSDTSVTRWLDHTDYPFWRKEELTELDEEEVRCWWRHTVCKSFIKDEPYDEFKHFRTINPRDDYFKRFSGPIFKLIEEEVFKLPYFIKKVPIDLRADYIMDHVYADKAKYVVTDYTSFESSFMSLLMASCEMLLYYWMSHTLPGGEEWFEGVYHTLTGEQVLKSKGVTTRTMGGRASGDQCTSLGNGFTNLMLMLFIAHKQNLGTLFGVFEGDDGLCRFSSGRVPDTHLLRQLGFNVKMEVVENLSDASFCGMVFHPDERLQMADPCRIIADFGWTSARYLGAKKNKKMGLLRSKALSLAFQYPGCPIVDSLARRVLYLTRGADVRWVAQSRNTSQWWRERLLYCLSKDIPDKRPGPMTRQLFETRYGITVEQQIHVEEQIEKLELGPFRLDVTFPELWSSTWERYVVRREPVDKDPWHIARQTEARGETVYRQGPRFPTQWIAPTLRDFKQRFHLHTGRAE